MLGIGPRGDGRIASDRAHECMARLGREVSLTVHDMAQPQEVTLIDEWLHASGTDEADEEVDAVAAHIDRRPDVWPKLGKGREGHTGDGSRARR